jgi:hypothetical protein
LSVTWIIDRVSEAAYSGTMIEWHDLLTWWNRYVDRFFSVCVCVCVDLAVCRIRPNRKIIFRSTTGAMDFAAQLAKLQQSAEAARRRPADRNSSSSDRDVSSRPRQRQRRHHHDGRESSAPGWSAASSTTTTTGRTTRRLWRPVAGRNCLTMAAKRPALPKRPLPFSSRRTMVVGRRRPMCNP